MCRRLTKKAGADNDGGWLSTSEHAVADDEGGDDPEARWQLN